MVSLPVSPGAASAGVLRPFSLSEPRRAVFLPLGGPRECPGVSGLHTGLLWPPRGSPNPGPGLFPGLSPPPKFLALYIAPRTRERET